MHHTEEGIDFMNIGDTVPANLCTGTETVGGRIGFMEDGLVFTPHRRVHADRMFIPYLQIWMIFRRNMLKIVPYGISVFTKDGIEYKFAVRRREAVADFITLRLS
jgi:hypothetical protein